MLLGSRAPLLDRSQVELGDPRAQPRHLDDDLLGPLRRRRLQRQRSQALAHLLLDVARALDLEADARELELGAMLPPLELPEPGGLLEQLPPVGRLGGQHRVHLSLRHDRVHRAPETDVGEQLDEIRPPHRRAVDEVGALAASHQPPHDRHLAEVELVTEAAVRVVEDELHLAVLGRLAVTAACEEDVVGALGAQLGRSEAAGGPDDRIGDVRLAGAVRTDDDCDPGLELQLERVGEGLEAAQAQGAQVHADARLAVAADGP